MNGIFESQRGEINRALAGGEQLRRDQQLLHEHLLEQNRNLREAQISLNEMEELKRVHGSTYDTISRRKLVEDRDTITAKIQELQNEINCMNDLRDFLKCCFNTQWTIPRYHSTCVFPTFSRSWRNAKPFSGNAERNDRPPSIWDTHGIPGNVFANPTASSSALYPPESNPWISVVSEHTSPHVMSESQTPVQDQRCQSGPSARNSFDPKEGRFSKNCGADQQRLQISDLPSDKFTTPATFACWKIRFKIEVFVHNFPRLCCGSKKWSWLIEWMISNLLVLLEEFEHQILKYSTRRLI